MVAQECPKWCGWLACSTGQDGHTSQAPLGENLEHGASHRSAGFPQGEREYFPFVPQRYAKVRPDQSAALESKLGAEEMRWRAIRQGTREDLQRIMSQIS
jgi:hypothetical protein